MKLEGDEKEAVTLAQKDRLSVIKACHGSMGLWMASLLLPDQHMDPQTLEKSRSLRDRIGSASRSAETIALPRTLCQIVQAQSPNYPGNTVHAEDVLFPSGWAHFTEPITHAEWGDLPIRSLLWWTHTTTGGPFDEGSLAVSMISFTPTKAYEGVTSEMLNQAPRVTPNFALTWQLDREGGLAQSRRNSERQRAVQLYMTLWAVLRQRMVETAVVPQVMPKQFATAQKRTPQRINQSTRVLRLSASTRHQAREYSGQGNTLSPDYSFWVRCHWRNHWYPKKEIHKPKLIMPFVKGDQSSPPRHQDRIWLPPQPLEEEST